MDSEQQQAVEAGEQDVLLAMVSTDIGRMPSDRKTLLPI